MIKKTLLTNNEHLSQRLLKYTLSMIVLFTLLICVTANVYLKSSLTTWNQPLFHFLQSLHTPSLSSIAIFITNLGYFKLVLISSMIIAVALALQPNRKNILCFLLSLICTIGMVWLLKKTIYSPRPLGFNLVKKTYSFPSGHTALSVMLFGSVAFYTAQIKPSWKKPAYAIAVFIVILVAISRLYLGAHWFTDIIGSVIVGSLCLCINAFLYYRLNSSLSLSIKKWAVFCLLGIVAPWLIYSIKHQQKQFYNYTPKISTITISNQQWWLKPSQTINKTQIPLYRIGRFGKPRQPLNIQWQGSLKDIKKSLISLHFKAHETHASLKRDIQNMSNVTADQQPLLPWLHNNKHPALLMTHPFEHDHIVIEVRIWPSQIKMKGANQPPIWMGAINFHVRQPFFSWRTHYQSVTYTQNNTIASQWLQLQLQKKWKTQSITLQRLIHTKELDAMKWRGRVVLVTDCHLFSKQKKDAS